MRKYLKKYLYYVDCILDQNRSGTDYFVLKQEHLNQIKFMEHERLIHLLVTGLFSILLFISVIGYALSNEVFFLPASGLLLVMTIAYIRHYYFLENSVQKMYSLYQVICERCGDFDKIEGENIKAVQPTYANQPIKKQIIPREKSENDYNSVNDLIAELKKEKSRIS